MRRFSIALALILSLATAPVMAAERQPIPANQAIDAPINDPLEPFNRAVFQFNRFVDFIILHPLAYVYKNTLPSFVQTSVGNVLGNLASPVVMLNQLLQGEFNDFETVLHRFVINSTLGLGGLNDVASHLQLPAPQSADFGQTLGKWGAGHGFYLVLPVFGPSSLRDGVGRGVDSFADPFTHIWMDSETEWPIYTRAALTAIDRRAQVLGSYDDIMKNSVDPYVTFRSIYVQQRAYMVQGQASTDSYGAYDQAE